jgi:hypothetical protein
VYRRFLWRRFVAETICMGADFFNLQYAVKVKVETNVELCVCRYKD